MELERRLSKLVFLLVVAFPLMGNTHMRCENALSARAEVREEAAQLSFVKGASGVKYLSLVNPLKGGSTLETSQLLPELDEHRRLVVVFAEGHPSILFRGHLLDARGETGLAVTPEIREHTRIGGDLAIVVSDLGDQTLTELDNMVADFDTRVQLTCASVTCRQMRETMPELGLKQTISPARLLADLLRAKSEGHKIEVVSLNGESLEANVQKVKKQERHELIGAGITGVAMTVFGYLYLLMH